MQDVAKTFIGMGVFGGHRATPESVALILNTAGRICVREDSGEDEAETRWEHCKRACGRCHRAAKMRLKVS